jgi:thiopeptide-type bacteriocin biosynthesis protein
VVHPNSSPPCCSAFDTYEREVERYGGPIATTASESIFAADSRAVVALLSSARRMDRLLLALVSTDNLLSSLGLDESAKLKWLKESLSSRKEFGDEYRAKRTEFIALFENPSKLGPVLEILNLRSAALASATGALARLEADGTLTQPRSKLYSSYVHMHLNRMWGDSTSEKRVLGLLLRTRDSMAHHRRASPEGPY